ncbi:putative ELM2 domain-containing protein [Helianthus debilis subsp. tardiflorus]
MKSTRKNWFNYINDDEPKLVIPIGPRFQANVPEWTGPPHKNKGSLSELDSSKWLGTVIWPIKNPTPEIEGCAIGKGRPESCGCMTTGSVLCVKRHIIEKTNHLQTVLGPAFQKWKFDLMGEAVAKLWKQQEEQKLTHLMKNNRFLEGQDFITLALRCFPLKSKKDIVNFYFNVYIPRQMSIQTRLGCKMVNTDDDQEEKPKNPYKGSRKKARVDCVTVYGPKLVKARYLTGRR